MYTQYRVVQHNSSRITVPCTTDTKKQLLLPKSPALECLDCPVVHLTDECDILAKEGQQELEAISGHPASIGIHPTIIQPIAFICKP
jgi:hypothetical protein